MTVRATHNPIILAGALCVSVRVCGAVVDGTDVDRAPAVEREETFPSKLIPEDGSR